MRLFISFLALVFSLSGFSHPNAESLFTFVKNPKNVSFASNVIVVPLSNSLFNKTRVLTRIATRLEFPKYFEENFDALEEMLTDLSWVEPTKKVVLLHASLPAGYHPDEQKAYVNVLASVAETIQKNKKPQLEIYFSESDKAAVQALLQ